MKSSKAISKGWKTTSPVPADVLASLEELGITVHRITYQEAWALCPGHESRLGRPNNRPNKWSINIDTGIHSCFSCGFSGSFVTLVREVLDYDYDDAAEWVRARGGGLRRLHRVLAASSYGVEPEPRIREWNEARLALFTDPPISARDGRRVSSGALSHYGILWSDGDDPFWVLPIRDPHTYKFIGYQEKSENGWVSNKPYGVEKSKTLFGIDVFDSPFVLVLESPLDCAVAYTNGIMGAVSTFGSKISEVQLDLLLDLGVPIIFGMDNDESGQQMHKKIYERYRGSGYPIKFLNYDHMSDKKDIGTDGVSKSDIQKAVLSAKSLVKFRV